MSNIDKQALREEFQYMQEHYNDPADRDRQVIYIAAEALLDELEAAEKRIAKLEVLAFSPAILDVISERQRQRSVEGWTSEHDDAYQNSELADAAACYAIHAHNQGFSTPAHWPWSPNWWKQSGARRDLVKAGALILAEIERLDRAAGIRINGEG
nr:MAG TPA: Ead/Ea22-like protein [Caudoviricetes sp.]